MRYRLLNVDSDEVVKLTVWYSRPNRLDVFVDGQFIIATNARIQNGRYIITMPKGLYMNWYYYMMHFYDNYAGKDFVYNMLEFCPCNP